MEVREKSIHIIKASRMTKIDLAIFVLGITTLHTIINLTIDEDLWLENGGIYHPPIHVYNIESKKIINLIDLGITKGLIHKTQNT